MSSPAYQGPAPDEQPDLAIRRRTDRCFFAVEEVVHWPDGQIRGYIVEGVLIDPDDVAQVRRGKAACTDPTTESDSEVT